MISRYLMVIPTALSVGFSDLTNAAILYLNNQNISVALGSSMAAEPFANRNIRARLERDSPKGVFCCRCQGGYCLWSRLGLACSAQRAYS